jgi:hypothetical protein
LIATPESDAAMKTTSKIPTTETTEKPRLSLKKSTLLNLSVQSGVRAGRMRADPPTDCVCHCNPTQP